MSNYNIAAVGVSIPSLGDNNISIYSMESLSSFDIIIFRPCLPNFYGYGSINFSNGGNALNYDGYKDFKKQTAHWFAELNDALIQKKTVLILTVPNEDVRYSTGYNSPRKGETVYSTGLDNVFQHILPYIPKMRESRSSEIFVCKNDISSLVKKLLDSCKEHTIHEVIFIEAEKSCIPLLMTKSKQKVAFIFNSKTGGRLIFWPNINFEFKGSLYRKNDKGYWTDKAMTFGKAFLKSLVELNKSFEGICESAPDWVLV